MREHTDQAGQMGEQHQTDYNRLAAVTDRFSSAEMLLGKMPLNTTSPSMSVHSAKTNTVLAVTASFSNSLSSLSAPWHADSTTCYLVFTLLHWPAHEQELMPHRLSHTAHQCSQ